MLPFDFFSVELDDAVRARDLIQVVYGEITLDRVKSNVESGRDLTRKFQNLVDGKCEV